MGKENQPTNRADHSDLALSAWGCCSSEPLSLSDLKSWENGRLPLLSALLDTFPRSHIRRISVLLDSLHRGRAAGQDHSSLSRKRVKNPAFCVSLDFIAKILRMLFFRLPDIGSLPYFTCVRSNPVSSHHYVRYIGHLP